MVLEFGTAAVETIELLLINILVGVTQVDKHASIFIKPSLILQVLQGLGWLNTELGTSLLVSILGLSFSTIIVLNGKAKFIDRLNEHHVVGHDLQGVGLVDLIFDLETFLQGVHRILQELSLVIILLLDVRIDITILGFLILDEVKETLVHSNFQLLVIISVLNDLVNSVFEGVDIGVVSSNDVSVLLNGSLDNTLAYS